MKDIKTNFSADILKDFLINFQKAVSDTGLTTYALAKKIGLDKAAIKNILQNKSDPRLSTAVCIAKWMGLSLDGLVGIAPPQLSPVPEIVELKKDNVSLINKINDMNDQDVELLDEIAGILIVRRTKRMAKLIKAVRDESTAVESSADCDTEEFDDEYDLYDDCDFDDEYGFEDDDGYDDDTDWEDDIYDED